MLKGKEYRLLKDFFIVILLQLSQLSTLLLLRPSHPPLPQSIPWQVTYFFLNFWFFISKLKKILPKFNGMVGGIIWEYVVKVFSKGKLLLITTMVQIISPTNSWTACHSILFSIVFCELNGSSPNWWHLLPGSHWAISFSTSVLSRKKCPFLGISSILLWHFNMSQSWNDYNLCLIESKSAMPWRTAQPTSTCTSRGPKRA